MQAFIHFLLALAVAFVGLGATIGAGLTGDWDTLPDLDVMAGDLTASLAELGAGTTTARGRRQ